MPGFDSIRRDTVLADERMTGITEMRLSGAPGIMLPQRDQRGRIVAMMIRLDQPSTKDPNKKSLRYLPVTSYTPTGCRAKVGVHVPIHAADCEPKTVRIIEGIIKADVATLRTGILTLGIPNGGRWLAGVRRSETIGAETILLAPDADTRENKGICATFVQAADELAAKGTSFAVESWRPGAGKGLDDVLHVHAAHDVIINEGVDAWKLLKGWLASSKAPPTRCVEARLLLEQVIERTKADPGYPFRPGIAEALGVLDEGAVETQRLLGQLRKLLQRSGWRDFEKKLKEARAKKARVALTNKDRETEARGGHVFKLGDQAEASLKLLDDLTNVSGKHDDTLCVFDRGSLFRYEDGLFTKVEESGLITSVAAYSGSAIAGGGVLKVSAGYCKGTTELLYARCSRLGYFDEAPAGIAFKNGFLLVDAEAKTVRLVPATQDHRVRVRYEFDYVAGGKPTRFLAALDRYFRSDPDKAQKIACIQEFVGASIVGIATAFQKAVVLRGPAGNDGKSTLAKILIKAVPGNAVAAVPPQKFDNDYSRASLDGVLLNVVFELPEGDLLDAAPLKALFVGDPMQARNPYQRPFDLRSRAGHLFVCNRLFRVKDPDSAFRRRWIIIDFNDPLGPEEIDASFVEQVVAEEIQAIVSWAIEGLARRLQAKDYTIPPSSVAAVNEWLREHDTLGAFMSECVAVLDTQERSSRDAWTKATPLYAEYAAWAKANGHPPMSSSTFGSRLKLRLTLKPKDCERSDGNYYPVRLKVGAFAPLAGREAVSEAEIEAALHTREAAANLVGTSEVAAVANDSTWHLRLVEPEDGPSKPDAPMPQTDEGEYLAVYDRLDASDRPDLYIARARTTGNTVAFAIIPTELRDHVEQLIEDATPLVITVRLKPRPDGDGNYAGITTARIAEELSA